MKEDEKVSEKVGQKVITKEDLLDAFYGGNLNSGCNINLVPLNGGLTAVIRVRRKDDFLLRKLWGRYGNGRPKQFDGGLLVITGKHAVAMLRRLREYIPSKAEDIAKVLKHYDG